MHLYKGMILEWCHIALVQNFGLGVDSRRFNVDVDAPVLTMNESRHTNTSRGQRACVDVVAIASTSAVAVFIVCVSVCVFVMCFVCGVGVYV